MEPMHLRDHATSIFHKALNQLDLRHVMHQHLRCHAGILHVFDTTYRLDDFRRIRIVSLGKAAVPMAAALTEILTPALSHHHLVDGIVVGTTAATDPNLRSFLGGHPVPDQHSLAAANAVLDLLAGCGSDSLVFFLLSGGASAMLEKPLDPALTPADTAAFHQALVHSGLPIAEMNALRKHLSAVKGGRLALAAHPATQCTLLVSDVPGNALHVVGSGPTLPDPSTIHDCRQILARNTESLTLPEKVARFFAGPIPETPKQDHPAFLRSSAFTLLSSDDLCREAADQAALEGFHVIIDNTCDEWTSDDAAAYLLDRISNLRSLHPRVCLLSAGEVSVKVPQPHGIGGRNQHFALTCALRLAHTSDPITVLSAGSDGIDGNSTAAGAVADQTTVARAAALGLDPAAALARFNSNAIFTALGDTVVTGPTGNNVRDLRILLSAT